MGLFGKKKERPQGSSAPEAPAAAQACKPSAGVKVLGGGCDKCHALAQATTEALAELGIEEGVELVTDFTQIAAYGVMSTPALVVDGKVVASGQVLIRAQVKALVEKARS